MTTGERRVSWIALLFELFFVLLPFAVALLLHETARLKLQFEFAVITPQTARAIQVWKTVDQWWYLGIVYLVIVIGIEIAMIIVRVSRRWRVALCTCCNIGFYIYWLVGIHLTNKVISEI